MRVRSWLGGWVFRRWAPIASAFVAVVAVAAQPGTTWRVSLSSAGTEGSWGNSLLSSISADGRIVAFESLAQGLVPDDTNGEMDIFVRDRATGTTERVSVGPLGAQATVDSESPSVSADGRLVAFHSLAPNLVLGDTNGAHDVFVHDRSNHTTYLVSRANGGGPANGSSMKPAISADGRFVAYESYASNLVQLDTNGRSDIFVTELQTGTTWIVSRASDGTRGNYDCYEAAISADGQFVAFNSLSTNLAPNDTNNRDDVFVHQRQTQQTWRVSVSSTGAQAAGGSVTPSLSGDGRFVAFYSDAANLVTGDTNNSGDVFVRDRLNSTTVRASVSPTGAQANNPSYDPSFSQDGRYVAFWSYASNLVTGDTNGWSDSFVRDLELGQTVRITIATSGAQGNGDGGVIGTPPSLSADGAYVSFTSGSSNLVSGDTNNRFDVFVRQLREGSAPVSGRAVLVDYVGNVDAETVAVELLDANGSLVQSIPSLDLGPGGEYSFSTTHMGTFTIAMKGRRTLRRAIPNVVVSSSGVAGLDFTLEGGDIDGDNVVTVFDYNLLCDAFDSAPGDANWDALADLDGDGTVSVFDFNILSGHFDASGD